ncbi:MAG: DUF4340 domain-containing protein [Phycisphaerae bacterium]|nr:DUF4340 domain-containing protein [Phycisphaerae bacterium]
MNPKTTIVLVIALLLAVVGVWFSMPSKEAVDETLDLSPKPLLGFAVDDVTGYEFKQGDEPTCIFVRDGERWRMTAPTTAVAENFTINDDLTKIVGLKYEQAYQASDPDRPSDEITSLVRPLRVIKLTRKNGKSVVVRVGAAQKLSRKTYAQIEGDQTIYAVTGDINSELRRKLSDYRGKRLSEFKIGDAVRIDISGSENCRLVKADSGWMLEDPVRARADLQSVNKVLNAIANMNALQFVEDQPRSLRPYGLESPRLIVRVTTEQKTPKPAPEFEGPTTQPMPVEYDVETRAIEVAFGGAAENRVFAKLNEPASSAVFQVNETLLKDAGPTANDLRDKRLAMAQFDRASTIKLTMGGESVQLVRTGGTWTIAGDDGNSAPAEFAAVDELIKTLRDTRVLGFEATELPEYGLANPSVTIELTIEGDLSPISLALGSETPSRTGVYLKNLTDQFIAVIPSAAAEKLRRRPVTFRTREIISFDSSNVIRLDVIRPNETLIAEKTNGTWSLTAPVSGRAELGNVTRILADLSALRGRSVVALANEAANYGLTDTATKAVIHLQPPTPSTQPTDALEPQPIVETVRVARHAGLIYAMREGGATICEIDALVANNLDAELLDTNVFVIEPAKIRKLAFEGGAPFTFEFNGDAWKLVGEATFAVDANKVTPVLATLRDLKASRYVKYSDAELAQYGLDAPELTIRVTDDTDHVSNLMISPRGPADGGRYAMSSIAPNRVFVINAEDIAKLIVKVTDFQRAS